MGNFKNTILIIVFNYSYCICNKNILKNIYEKYFKQIIFYSDTLNNPNNLDNEINFINIEKGHYTHKIFNHFYFKILFNFEIKDL